MLKIRLLFFSILFLSNSFFSQKYIDEFAVMGGGSYYIGDLNPTRHFNNYKPAFGLLYRRNFWNKQLVLRFHLMYGTVAASNSKNSISNLSFRSRVLEIGPILEINFMPYEIGDVKKHKGTPYLFAGITYFKMDPQSQNKGDWVSLQTLGTEGQESSLNQSKQYKTKQISLPVGIGVKINLNKRFALNFEYGIRKTYTDYLDDVSGTYVDRNILEVENGKLSSDLNGDVNIKGLQRGNSKNKDWYSFYGAMLSFRILPKSECRTNFGRN